MESLFPSNIFRRFHWPGSPYQLAVLRMAMGVQVFYAVNSKIFDLLLAVGARQGTHTLFPEVWDSFIAAHCVPGLLLACKVLSVLLVLGVFTRLVLPLLTFAFVALFGFYYLGVNAPIHWLYLWFPLLVFCFAGSEHVWSIDAIMRRSKYKALRKQGAVQYRWPVELTLGWFVYIYFAAGLAKVFPILKGVAWLNGQTSKEIIYYRYLDSPFHYLFGQPFFNYAEASFVFGALTISAVLLELFTIVLLFTNRFHILVLVLVIAMHFFLYLTGVAGFMQTALVLGLALLKPQRFDQLAALLPSTPRREIGSAPER